MCRSMVAAILFASLSIVSAAWGDGADRKSAQIVTPDGKCVAVEKVEADSVYLKSRPGRCGVQKIPVIVEKGVFSVKVFVDGVQWMEQGLVAAALPDMDKVKGEAMRIEDGIKLPDLEKNKAAVEAAKKSSGYINSQEYQARIAAEADRIRSEVFSKEMDVVRKYYPDGKPSDVKKTGPVLRPDERVYVFISSSMPVETLSNYIKSMDKANEPGMAMVMRGMVGGVSKLKPTMEFIASFLVKDPDCLKRSMQSGGTEECESYSPEVLIDPYLFNRYGITSVPAVVFATGVKPENTEMSEGDEENTKIGPSTTIYGDGALDGILEIMADSTKSKSLEAVVRKLRAGYY